MSVLATYSYTLIDSSTHYSVTCTNTSVCTEAIIPSEYNGKPVTKIGSHAFEGCSSLTSVTIPDSITLIDGSAFTACTSLTNITIPDSVTSISERVFYWCGSLTSVTIGNSVTSIGENAFSDCSSLTSIKIPDSVTSIGYEAFYGCINLTNVKIGNGVTSIGSNAFNSSTLLTNVYIMNTTPPTLGYYVFPTTADNLKINVPMSSVSTYKAAVNWSEYSSNIVGISNLYLDFMNYSSVIKKKYQKSTDNSLATESKTIVGAINELNAKPAGGATNLENGSGTNAVQQKQDGTSGYVDYTGKNPNATALDSSITGNITYGASGNYSAAFGGKSVAQGKRSLAEGTTTLAKGNYSHAEGDNSVALGGDSHAEGYATVTNGQASHSEGASTQATGIYSHAEGLQTIASGEASHATGTNTLASGKNSTTFGIGANATAENSVAFGCNTYANGTNSIAAGIGSVASYENDFVFGKQLENTLENQIVVGRFNDASNWGSVRPLFMVGNGTDNDNRSNALEVMADGRVKAMGTPIENNDVVRLSDLTKTITISPAQILAPTSQSPLMINPTSEQRAILEDDHNSVIKVDLSSVYQTLGLDCPQAYIKRVKNSLVNLISGAPAINTIVFEVSSNALNTSFQMTKLGLIEFMYINTDLPAPYNSYSRKIVIVDNNITNNFTKKFVEVYGTYGDGNQVTLDTSNNINFRDKNGHGFYMTSWDKNSDYGFIRLQTKDSTGDTKHTLEVNQDGVNLNGLLVKNHQISLDDRNNKTIIFGNNNEGIIIRDTNPVPWMNSEIQLYWDDGITLTSSNGIYLNGVTEVSTAHNFDRDNCVATVKYVRDNAGGTEALSAADFALMF